MLVLHHAGNLCGLERSMLRHLRVRCVDAVAMLALWACDSRCLRTWAVVRDTGPSECSASASVVPDMFYHVPTNSLMTTVCQPGPPYNDDCSTPDVEEFGVKYWRRSGLATGTLACRTE